MIAIIGSEGSMGKRYQAILNYLGEPFIAIDKTKPSDKSVADEIKKCDRIIIATPTNTHVALLKELLPTRLPILCEKPITKDIDELIDLHAFCARSGLKYEMVYQYKELNAPAEKNRWSYYDYFRHGSDGLAWDCIQIIGLAQGPVWLKEESPVWECTINGTKQSLSDMDKAYITMMRKWLNRSLDQTMDEILHVHQKVVAYIESQNYGRN